MTSEFKANVNLMSAFNSQVMLINDIENSENGQTFIKAGADGPQFIGIPNRKNISK